MPKLASADVLSELQLPDNLPSPRIGWVTAGQPGGVAEPGTRLRVVGEGCSIYIHKPIPALSTQRNTLIEGRIP
jgi:hypothetical protein